MRCPLDVRRPCRIPSDYDARFYLARDLSKGNEEKARRLMRLPLMEVALMGSEGADLAEKEAGRAA